MNCRETENLLFAERDGTLTTEQRAALGRHVAECSACRHLRADLATAADTWRTATARVKAPDADTEWRKLHARLHGAEVRTPAKRRLAPIVFRGENRVRNLLWLAAPLAAAAAVALALFVQTRQANPAGSETTPATAALTARAEYVQVSGADASPMVYLDKESGWLVVWAVDGKAPTSG